MAKQNRISYQQWIVGPASRFKQQMFDFSPFEQKLWAVIWEAIKEIRGVPNLWLAELQHVVKELPSNEGYHLARVFGLLTNATYACRLAGLIGYRDCIGTDSLFKDQEAAYSSLMYGGPEYREPEERKSTYTLVQFAITETDEHILRLPATVSDDDFLPFIEEVERRYVAELSSSDLLLLPSHMQAYRQEQEELSEEVVDEASALSSHEPVPVNKLHWQKRSVDLAILLHALYKTRCIRVEPRSERQFWELVAAHFSFDTEPKNTAAALRQAYRQVKEGTAGKGTWKPERLGEFVQECRGAIDLLTTIVDAFDTTTK